VKPRVDPTGAFPVVRVSKAIQEAEDRLVVEEPMEIRVRWQNGGAVEEKSIAITMRTPGEDFDLATGFLFAEGIIGGRDDVVDVAYCLDVEEPQERNVVTVTLAPGIVVDAERLQRNIVAYSSCGLCGKATLESLDLTGYAPIEGDVTVPRKILGSLPERMRAGQPAFEATGGLHAAALFATDGTLISLREDVGRHNAVDKVVGEQFMEGTVPLGDRVLLVSGRAGFEILQKALAARAPIVAAIGARSTLAVELAERFGMTLVGFLREEKFNVYSHAERITGNR
jgi:FdhD protein